MTMRQNRLIGPPCFGSAIVIVAMTVAVLVIVTMPMIVRAIVMLGMRHRRVEGMGVFRPGLRPLRFVAQLAPAAALQMKIRRRQQFGKLRFAAVGTIDQR